ncbi:hypothetical protein [Sphingobacterium faecium]|uniref:hypothetical protein n=1 Tax=Sphingobacterium faecium TaxID=34087 RepID=UPI001649FF74|nr:hypothetical protein [Sphingobacterium faecium]
MERKIIAGTITLPTGKREKTLHKQLGKFALWMQIPKDANEIQKDKQQSVPVSMLPIVF